MNPFLTTRAKILAVTGTIAVTAAASTAIAFASATGPARAPYAQAAGLVEYNGAVSQNKGISVTKPSPGINCITFSDSRIDPQKIIPQATIGAMGDSVGQPGATENGSTVMIRTDPFDACGNNTQAVTVITSDSKNNYADIAFYFSVA